MVRIHRLPSVETTGQEGALAADRPRGVRLGAMAPLGVSLGLRPWQVLAADKLPVKALAEERVVTKGLVPAGCVYVRPTCRLWHGIQTLWWPNCGMTLRSWGPPL